MESLCLMGQGRSTDISWIKTAVRSAIAAGWYSDWCHDSVSLPEALVTTSLWG